MLPPEPLPTGASTFAPPEPVAPPEPDAPPLPELPPEPEAGWVAGL
jgi:hypothetical protein